MALQVPGGPEGPSVLFRVRRRSWRRVTDGPDIAVSNVQLPPPVPIVPTIDRGWSISTLGL